MSNISQYKGKDNVASFKDELAKDKFTLVIFSAAAEDGTSKNFDHILDEIKKKLFDGKQNAFVDKFFSSVTDQLKEQKGLLSIVYSSAFSALGDGSILVVDYKAYPELCKQYKVDIKKSFETRLLTKSGRSKDINTKELILSLIAQFT